jgi:peptidyl-Lys metalloendopeptidase
MCVAVALSACAPDEDDEATPNDGSDVVPVARGLVSRVELVNDWLGKDDEVVVRWTLVNEGGSTLLVPPWQVPGDTLEANVFDVTREGLPVRYIGKLVKRAAPSQAELVPIAPGETLSATFPLSRYYQMEHAGEYAILHRDTVRGEPMQSNRVIAYRSAENPDADAPRPRTPEQSAVGAGYRSCSSSQKSKIKTALQRAENYAREAEGYLSDGLRGSRYRTWFGRYSSSRYSAARSHFNKLREATQNERFTFDCDCDDSAFAYVYPDDPYVIHLCQAFWSAPTTGTDSKAGTIIHESSHFNVIAGTDDWVYGQSGCQDLANSQPAHAVANADSHEYFAENNPQLD